MAMFWILFDILYKTEERMSTEQDNTIEIEIKDENDLKEEAEQQKSPEESEQESSENEQEDSEEQAPNYYDQYLQHFLIIILP